MSEGVQPDVQAERVPVVPMLCVGEGIPEALLAACREQHIGVIATRSNTRALQLLQHFQVSAILCADAAVTTALAATGTPIILLGTGEMPTSAGMTVINRHTASDTLARVIRNVATGQENGGVVAS